MATVSDLQIYPQVSPISQLSPTPFNSSPISRTHMISSSSSSSSSSFLNPSPIPRLTTHPPPSSTTSSTRHRPLMITIPPISLGKKSLADSASASAMGKRQTTLATALTLTLAALGNSSSTTENNSAAQERARVTVDGGKGQPDFYQNVVAMRHGDRLDNFDPNWVNTAARPWDPPLIDDGKARAFRTGRTLRNSAGFPIHRVFVSPFIRCVQTATQAIYALTAVEDDPTAVRGDDLPIDQSKLKANVELGLCEMLNTIAIKPNLVPRDGKWGFNVSELEAILPAGTVDPTVERVYNELPKWEESVLETRTRYQQIYKALADKYPTENLLLVTHGEAVGVAVSTYLETTVYGVEYCAYAKLRRPIYRVGDSFKAGNFEVVTDDGLPGIKYASIGENE